MNCPFLQRHVSMSYNIVTKYYVVLHDFQPQTLWMGLFIFHQIGYNTQDTDFELDELVLV